LYPSLEGGLPLLLLFLANWFSSASTRTVSAWMVCCCCWTTPTQFSASAHVQGEDAVVALNVCDMDLFATRQA
jgi:hypothetical protein